MKPDGESVYRDSCGEVRLVTSDYMLGGKLNDHDATDILFEPASHHRHSAPPDAFHRRALGTEERAPQKTTPAAHCRRRGLSGP